MEENKTFAPEQIVESVAEALTVVELEERFELTAAALDSARCSGNKVK
ncbi:hypothetical protein [Spirosoma validum]|uniref:Uncharacterized protein n=1 Tax=Spirosoma validum TaxID=2771355 RepID=A0A927B2B9_9BACT|nr:hypothetical protein [Spirosoma validum]MBD2754079.1 hypothetical protein [Spirosoma validum]